MLTEQTERGPCAAPHCYRPDMIRRALALLEHDARDKGFIPLLISIQFEPDGTLTFTTERDADRLQRSIPPSGLNRQVQH